MLTKDEQVGKLTCKKGAELGVDANKRIVFCTTARAVDVDGLAVAADAYTLVHPNGRIYQTHVRAAFEVTLADKTTVKCAANLVALHDDGHLRYCELAAKRAGSPRPRVGGGISFHPDGRIASLTLDEPFEAAGLALPAGTFVGWDAKGALLGGYASDAIRAGALSIHYDFALHPSGKLATIQLAAAAKIQGHDFPADAKLGFRDDGTLEAAQYVADRGFMIHGEQWTDTRHMTFNPAGKITSSRIDHWQSPIGEGRHK